MAKRLHALTLLVVVACVFLTPSVVCAEECSGHGKIHGSHCHCLPGYKNKGLECLSVGGSDGGTCAAGGITWEASSIMFLVKGSYTIELVNNTESMATFLLPLVNVTEATTEVLETSVEFANQLLEDVTLARKIVKNNQMIAPTTKLLFVIARNNVEELEKLKAECEVTAGNMWHIDHCDGPEGHGRRHRRHLVAQPLTTISMTIDASAHYALHLQHNAVKEFAMRILDAQDQSIQSLVTKASGENEGTSTDADKPKKKATGAVWAKTMGAVAVVTIISVVGILLLVVRVSLLEKLMDAFIALSAGALFGTGVLHILPESIEFYSAYGQMDLVICMVFIAGFMMAMLVEMLLELFIGQYTDAADHHHDHHAIHQRSEKDVIKMLSPGTAAQPDSVSDEPFTDLAAMETAAPGVHSTAPQQQSKSLWSLSVDWSTIKPMAYIILLGDLFHNFVDGVLIATAFLACDDSLGVAVMASAILHEIPQELADFIVLVDAGFTNFQAVIFNFLSALSSFIGAFVILSSVTVTNETMGLLLGFGAGTLMYISATDLLPRVLRVRTLADFFTRVILFCVGVGLLALTTLYHVHCDADA